MEQIEQTLHWLLQMSRVRCHAVWLVFLLAACTPTARARRSHFVTAMQPDFEQLTSAGSSTSAYGCPKHPVYEDPWVRDNIAFTYAAVIRDGLGGQTIRLMAVYSLAVALGVGYIHTPLECIGHIGGFPHWRNRTCDAISVEDRATTQRISKFLVLPKTVQRDSSSWHQEMFLKGSWDSLANISATARQLRQPTVIRIEWVHNFLMDCPDLFYHVPSWRPTSNAAKQQLPPIPWLLTAGRSKRIVVHMRRGDLSSIANKRALPTSFYLQVVKQVIQVLDYLHLDFSVEWFTELGSTAAEHEDLMRVRREVPNLSLQLNTDLLWNWQQMAAADVFVMSKSAYSMVPAVVNPGAVIIRAPASAPCKLSCTPSNWVITKDFEGNLSHEAIYYVRKQLSGG